MFRLPSLRYWRSDICAGLSVAVVAVPQSIAYAHLAGLPASVGLLATGIPTIVAGLLGASPYIASGATAIMALMTLSALSELAQPMSTNYIGYAALLALMAGSIQLLFFSLRAGHYVRLVSIPVAKGFVYAAALLIAWSQLTHLFVAQWDVLVMGAWSLAVLIFAPHLTRLPSVLLVTLIATIVSWSMGYDGPVVGSISREPTFYIWSDTTLASFYYLLIPAIAIAFVGFIEGFLVSEEIDHTHHVKKPNRELGALASANIISGFMGAMPVAGSVSRTVLQHAQGARTSLSSVVVGTISLLSLFILAPVFHFIPLATLGAIVFVAIIKIVVPRAVIHEMSQGRTHSFIFLSTCLATLVAAPHLEYGLVAGLIISFISTRFRN